MTGSPSTSNIASTLTVKNVRLPPEAYVTLEHVAQANEDEQLPLVDLQYVHYQGDSQQRTVEVHVSPSGTIPASSTNSLDLSHPFKSIAQDVEPPSTTTKTAAAAFAAPTQIVARFDTHSSSTTAVHSSCIDAHGSLSIPGGLCHPHIHLDKCFLLDRCRLSTGTFDEALTSTSKAKADFNRDDVIARMRRLVAASISHGVTCMRAFVEVDPTVGLMCLEAGIQVKNEFVTRCEIQLVAFAQDAIFYPDHADKQHKMHELMRHAASNEHVDVVGSAPYVEAISKDSKRLSDTLKKRKQKDQQAQNIHYIFDLARQYGKHVDFHLDYDLDPPGPDEVGEQSMIPLVVSLSQQQLWSHTSGAKPSITMGHCTKLSTFSSDNLDQLAALFPNYTHEVPPISFVSLPPSDLYMQGRSQPYASRSRATLPLLALSSHPTLRDRTNWAMGVNNVANLFTPQGDADPLALLPMMVAVWQSAKPRDCEVLLGAVSAQARVAAGLAEGRVWSDLTVLDGVTSVQEAVCAPGYSRITIKDGRLVARRKVDSDIL